MHSLTHVTVAVVVGSAELTRDNVSNNFHTGTYVHFPHSLVKESSQKSALFIQNEILICGTVLKSG